jgi:hypothetical protein
VANPAEWILLVKRYSHTAVAAKRYTATAFLAGVLARMGQRGELATHVGDATGRWSYNRMCGYYSLYPEPPWESRTTWAESGLSVTYVPGQTEL